MVSYFELISLLLTIHASAYGPLIICSCELECVSFDTGLWGNLTVLLSYCHNAVVVLHIKGYEKYCQILYFNIRNVKYEFVNNCEYTLVSSLQAKRK